MVPARISPLAARRRSPRCRSSKYLILVPEKYGSSTRPVLRRNVPSSPSAFSRSQIGDEIRLCQTMALATGWPVAFSQTTIVSRWLVMPIAATSRAGVRAARSAALAVASCVAQMASGSCSTCPGEGKICGNSRCTVAAGRLDRRNTIERLEVVP